MVRSFLRQTLLTLMLIGSSGVGGLCRAENAGLSADEAKLSLAGHVRHGRWAEIRLPQPLGDASPTVVEVHTLDGDGASVCYREVVPASEAEPVVPFQVGPLQAPLSVHLLQQETVVASYRNVALTSHSSTCDLLGLLGGSDAGLRKAVEKSVRLGNRDTALVELTLDDLPCTVAGYEPLTRLCVVVGSSNPLEELSAPRREALWRWLEGGGELVFVMSAGASGAFPSTSPWNTLLPGRLVGEHPLASGSGVEAFTGEPLTLAAEIADRPVVTEFAEVPRSQVWQWESNSGGSAVPLVMETLHGWGTVRWITLDLTNPQLARWPGLPRWWERLLAGRIASVEEQDANRRNRGQVTHRGYEDLAGQLRMALDRYEGVTPIHFYGVAGVILLYLCLLGPSEYFLLKRFMPRAMHITWYLLPILTGGMVATGTWLASVTQGTVVRMNQVELLDLHPQRGQLRGACWAGLFAPSARTFSLEMRVAPVGSPDALPAPSRLSWQTLSGRGLGGVDAPALVSVGHEPYELEGHDQFARLMRLSLPAASSKLLSGSWRRAWTPPAEFTQLRKGKLRDLEGTFLNVTPWELRNAYLAHGDWLYRAIDDIAPGDTVHVERLDRKHLESQLTRRKTISTGDLASPWNADDTDVARILELMLFHEAAGGESYTGLQHSPGKELDLSRCLRQGYAVLLGKVAVPLAEFQEEGKTVAADATRRWSYVRVLYPVAPASGMGSTAASAPAEETR